MKTIVVPTDFSSHATNALNFALDMAPALDAQVLLVHIIDIPHLVETLYMENSGVEELYRESKKRAEEELKLLRETHNSKILITATFQGSITSVLQELKENYQIELVVMGTRGASGLREAFVGSNTEKVIRNSNVPVISVPLKIELENIQNILVPTNGEDVGDGFFYELRRMEKLSNATFHILYVNALHNYENEEEIELKLKKYAKNANLQSYNIDFIKAITLEDGIGEYIKAKKIDMVAITTHGRHGLAHLIYGSLTENLVNHLKVPVYSYNLKTINSKRENDESKAYSGSY